MKRLIPKEYLPPSLWNDEDSILFLPPQLVASWEMLLDKNNLRERATKRAPRGFTGGRNKNDTDDHLAWRFTGPAARVMLPILDPKEDLKEISNTFARIFSGNKVFIADLPCGSGATSMSILSVLCELRKQSLLPRMPLDVVIVGGDISEYALHYAKEALESLRKELAIQAITVEFDAVEWDVLDQFSNSKLVKHLTLASQHCSTKLLVLANFSDFLQGDSKWKEARTQFEELFRHSRGENSVAIWIEPQKNNVIGESGFFPRLINWFKGFFISEQIDGDEWNQKNYGKTRTRVKHPLTDGDFRNHLAVIRFHLPPWKKP